jgi:CDP-glycerol glycerophosphotransferase (TagB/SpsB family)
MNKGPGILKVSFRWLGANFFRICDYLLPKDDRIVLVTLPDGDDQGVSLCLELARLHRDTKLYWLIQGDPSDLARWQQRRGIGHVQIVFLQLHSVQGIWAYLRARCVFYTHGAVFNYSPPKRKLVVNVWHGMPIKRIWRGVPGSELPMSTFLVSTSAFFSDVLMRASGFGAERLLATGLPRNDFLLNARPESKDIVARLRGNADRLIFFLPTYRNSARGFRTNDGTESNSILGLSEGDAQRLHAWLKANRCKLIVKPHPMSINVGKAFADDEHWAMVDEKKLFEQGLGLYELLAQADLLVTDVSSVYVDFLVTERPQILYFPDMDVYEKTRGLLIHPLKDYAPGPIARTFAELQIALDRWISGDDSWRARRKELRELMVPASTRSASESLLAAVGIRSQERTVTSVARPKSQSWRSRLL